MKRALWPLLLLAGATVAVAASAATTVTLRTATVGGSSEQVLATASGMTLYYFDKDAPGKSACTGGCAAVWAPLLLPNGAPTGPAGVAAGLQAFSGANGRQVEYHGHPLYTFSGDKAPGQANGNGVAGTWHVATPALTAASGTGTAATPAAATTANGGGNGGW